MHPAHRAIRRFLAGRGLDAGELAITAPPRDDLGDYAVGCFPFAKAARRPPPAIAAELAAAFEPMAPLLACVASGPYLNFRVDRAAFLGELLPEIAARGAAFADDASGAGRTVVIDYSSPNIAKHLAYHHIRSTMIGHSLRRIWAARGWRVVGINHLGDWGTTFGKLFVAIRRWGAGLDLEVDGVTQLNELYVRFGREAKAQPELEEEARQWFKRLEDHDPEARALWERVRAVSLAEYDRVYAELGVTFDRVMGESEFEALMPPVIDLLAARGLTSVSEGALVVDLSEDGMPPLLLRKADGATLYSTRDLAAARWRHDELRFDRALYVVDKGQALHFRQLFRVLEKAGFEWASRLEHVAFGLVRVGGKKTGTRAGGVVRLRDVLDEATEAIRARIAERNPALVDPDRVARQVGIGAVVFADLKTAREKDVDFNLEEVLAFDGDTGPYVQYTHARCASILRRAGLAAPPAGADVARLVLDEEWAVARRLAELPGAIQRAQESNEPMVLAGFVLDLAAAFSRYYDQGNRDPAKKVACADVELSRARLLLTACVRAVLARGLELLGIAAPDEM